MIEAFICDAVRTPFGRFGGGLSTIRPDDMGAIVIKSLQERNPEVNWQCVDDVMLGCANQAGEDNRNIARMSSLLAGLPVSVTGTTVNRLCASGLDALAVGSRAIKSGEANLIIAGGVESMSRAPYVLGKAISAFSRTQKIHDTTIGWRFINPQMKAQFGVDSMPETAENVAEKFQISRIDQDFIALLSQQRAAKAKEYGYLSEEIVPVCVIKSKSDAINIKVDEHPRTNVSAQTLASLQPIVKKGGTVTAGNSSGINDGAAMLLLASTQMMKKSGLTPLAKVVATVTAGIEPRIMGFAPALAIKKLLAMSGLKISDIDVIELNEAFAAQVLAVSRDLGLEDGATKLNPNGGAIALGHPLGASGPRLVMAAIGQLRRSGKRYAICTMCIGVGQGIAMLLENAENL